MTPDSCAAKPCCNARLTRCQGIGGCRGAVADVSAAVLPVKPQFEEIIGRVAQARRRFCAGRRFAPRALPRTPPQHPRFFSPSVLAADGGRAHLRRRAAGVKVGPHTEGNLQNRARPNTEKINGELPSYRGDIINDIASPRVADSRSAAPVDGRIASGGDAKSAAPRSRPAVLPISKRASVGCSAS